MSRAAIAMEGKLYGDDATFRGVSTDSRSVQPGQLFFALKGPNFDGVRFARQAAEKGAAGIVAQSVTKVRLPGIAVDDTRQALGRLGASWRRRMPATVIALTGSNGKTTLKEMVAAGLSQVAATLATRGNLNNDIGMPLMLLSLAREHRYAVLEMGANHAGEIAWLTSLAMPAIVAITNAGPSHLEGFGSIDGVARAKGEILQGADRPQTAVLNADDQYFDLWCSMASDLNIVSFGRAEDAMVRIADVNTDAGGSTFMLHLAGEVLTVHLPLPGLHNVTNAAAAAAILMAAGLLPEQIRAGLQAVQPIGGRLRSLPGLRGSRLFDDSYNANPASVTAAAEFIAAQDGESWLLLGDMGELGSDAAALHRDVGIAAKDAGVDRLLAMGPLTRQTIEGFGGGGEWFATADDLIAAAAADLRPDVNVLVKGSRFMCMERVVAALTAKPADQGGH